MYSSQTIPKRERERKILNVFYKARITVIPKYYKSTTKKKKRKKEIKLQSNTSDEQN